MHIVAVAWIFVVLLMAAAEASSTQGTLLGALFTLLLYGALPLSIVLDVMGTPARRRARLAAEARAAERSGASSLLSEREQQIIQAVALGHTNSEIGEQLHLSVRTVESHRARILRKLDLSTRAELVNYAITSGLFDTANLPEGS